MKITKIIQLLSLFTFIITDTGKSINLKSVDNTGAWDVSNGKFTFNMNIKGIGFTEQQKIKHKLKSPPYAEAECSIPISDGTESQNMDCEVDILKFPIESSIYLLDSFSHIKDISITSENLYPQGLDVSCKVSFNMEFIPSYLEVPTFDCKNNALTFEGQVNGGTIEENINCKGLTLCDDKFEETNCLINTNSQLICNVGKVDEVIFFATMCKKTDNTYIYINVHEPWEEDVECSNKGKFIKFSWLLLMFLLLI